MATFASQATTIETLGSAEGESPRAWSEATLARIRRRMERVCRDHGGVRLSSGADHVRVHASGAEGFDAGIVLSDGACIVTLGAWHDDFDSVDMAMEYLELAVKGALRLKIERVGARPRRWTVERRQDNQTWVEAAMMDVPMFFRTGARSTTYLRNDFRGSAHA
jgi:hypothetical protein